MGIVYLALGIVIGFIINYILHRNKSLGTLEIDMTNKDTPYYRLLMSNEEFEEIPKHSTVIFRVNSNSNFAHEKQVL